ncbi:MAG: DinB family protein [Acidimicrobiia bacterium]
MDQSRDQLLSRVTGLGDAEYLWEPAPNCWTVRPGDDGFLADFPDDDPDPSPLTTIAWRLWHIAVDCMDSYSVRAFGTSGTGLSGVAFVGTARQAVSLAEAGLANFRSGLADRGDEGVGEALGDEWGPYRDHTIYDLGLHAHRELTHHAAEIGTLRDLYYWTQTASLP